MKGNKFGIGILGCGMVANSHATAINEMKEAELIGVTDVIPEARQAFAEKHNTKAFGSEKELLADPEIDIVCICTPSGMHGPQSIEAAAAGKHIVVEKPMALTLKEVDQVIKAVEKNNVKMEVVSQLRFSESIKRLKKVVSEGQLGKLVSGDIYMKFYRSQEYYDSGGWRGTWKMDGGGALMNQGIHGVDVLQHIMGPVKSIFAHARTLARKIEVEDTASAVLEFQSGALGVIQATTSVSPGFPRRLEINGDKGSIALEEDSFIVWDIEGREVPSDITLARTESKVSSNPAAFSHKGHLLQITDLIEAIKEDRDPLVTPYEGRKPVEIITSIYQSSRTRKIIELK